MLSNFCHVLKLNDRTKLTETESAIVNIIRSYAGISRNKLVGYSNISQASITKEEYHR